MPVFGSGVVNEAFPCGTGEIETEVQTVHGGRSARTKRAAHRTERICGQINFTSRRTALRLARDEVDRTTRGTFARHQ